jgi:hypothetical protein
MAPDERLPILVALSPPAMLVAPNRPLLTSLYLTQNGNITTKRVIFRTI